jgi:hypothetical protein
MRNTLVVFPITAVLLLLSFGGSKHAHHGFPSWFDMTRSITVRGAVAAIDWTNPHSYIYLDVKDGRAPMKTGAPQWVASEC